MLGECKMGKTARFALDKDLSKLHGICPNSTENCGENLITKFSKARIGSH